MRAKTRRHRFFRITAGGWGVLALCLFLTISAINASLNIVYLLASLLASIFGMSLIGPLWTTRGLDCRRARKITVYAGEPVEMDAWLSSKRRISARQVTVADARSAKGASKGASDRRLLMSMPPRGEIRVSLALAPRKRGVYPLPPLRVASRFPFGFAESGFARSEEGELVVYPARGRLSAPLTSALDPNGWREGVPSRWGGQEADFRTIREYRPGDNLRSIHWRASARHGRLIIREHDRERSAPFTIVLDARIPASTPLDERETAAEALELAVSFAAEAWRTALRGGHSIRLIAFFPEVRVLSSDSKPATASGVYTVCRDFSDILEALARAKPSKAENADDLFGALGACAINGSAQVVVVTPTARSAEGIRSAPARITTRLYVAGDPSFARWFRLSAPTKGTA